MIRHTVVFRLKDDISGLRKHDFFDAAMKLVGIQGVQKFECLKQISTKNNFQFGISMEFDNQNLYEQYTGHPEHVYFVNEFWLKDVDDFLEIDYEEL